MTIMGLFKPTTTTLIQILLLITTLTSTAWSQQETLVPSEGSDTFPACAVACPLLQSAQTSCLPPAAPVTDRSTYVSCFCQSALLTTLHSSPSGICDANCPSAEDLTTLQSWYTSFCESGGEDGTGSQPTSDSPGSSPTGGSSSSGSEKQSWFAGHWRWVVMVIVLIVGFAILAAVGVWYKRRYHRKHDPLPTGSGILPPPNNRSSSAMQQREGWGPHQQTVHPRGAEFVDGNPSSSEHYLPHASGTSTPDVTVMAGRVTPTTWNARLTRGRGMMGNGV